MIREERTRIEEKIGIFLSLEASLQERIKILFPRYRLINVVYDFIDRLYITHYTYKIFNVTSLVSSPSAKVRFLWVPERSR